MCHGPSITVSHSGIQAAEETMWIPGETLDTGFGIEALIQSYSLKSKDSLSSCSLWGGMEDSGWTSVLCPALLWISDSFYLNQWGNPINISLDGLSYFLVCSCRARNSVVLWLIEYQSCIPTFSRISVLENTRHTVQPPPTPRYLRDWLWRTMFMVPPRISLVPVTCTVLVSGPLGSLWPMILQHCMGQVSPSLGWKKQ